jgi:hypothetical protein
MTAWDASRAIDAGNALHRDILAIDGQKHGISQQDMEARLTERFRVFCQESEIDLDISIRFCDVRSIIDGWCHTELAYVTWQDRRVTFRFDYELLQSADRNAGFIFIAKAWVLPLLMSLAGAAAPQQPVSFIYEIGDNATLESVAACSNHPDACLIVDYDFLGSQAYRGVREALDRDEVPWSRRIPKLFWRGSTTGRRLHHAPGPDEPDDFFWLQRLILCREALRPEIAAECDIGVTSIVQIAEPHLIAHIKAAGFLRPPVSRTGFAQYKYVVDIDGNSNAFSGLFCSLLGGSCVLKVGSVAQYRQWYYSDLVPWLNYVPLRTDLGDLAEILAWVQAHDAQAAEIAAWGRQLASSITLDQGLRSSAARLIEWLPVHARPS